MTNSNRLNEERVNGMIEEINPHLDHVVSGRNGRSIDCTVCEEGYDLTGDYHGDRATVAEFVERHVGCEVYYDSIGNSPDDEEFYDPTNWQ